MSPATPWIPQFGDSRPAVEPHADLRQLARLHRQIFVAYVEAGFTEQQAMQLMGVHVAAAYQGSEPPDPS